MTRIIGPYYHKVAQYVLQRYKYLRKSNYTTEDIHNNKFPTFEDYINFLVDEENIPYQNDLHWASYFSLCNPCSHKYDIIIKLETLTEDSSFLRKILSVDKTDYELIIPPSKNPERYNFMAYYSNLSKSLLKKLYLKYKFDFEAFGYDFKFLWDFNSKKNYVHQNNKITLVFYFYFCHFSFYKQGLFFKYSSRNIKTMYVKAKVSAVHTKQK